VARRSGLRRPWLPEIKATSRIVEKGPDYNKMYKMVKKRKPNLECKGLVIMKITDVFDCRSGAEAASACSESGLVRKGRLLQRQSHRVNEHDEADQGQEEAQQPAAVELHRRRLRLPLGNRVANIIGTKAKKVLAQIRCTWTAQIDKSARA
jgi:hypothetical protein